MKTSTARAIQCSAALATATLLLAGCGSSGGSSSGQSAKAASTTSFKGRGPITYVAGKDTTGTVQTIINR